MSSEVPQSFAFLSSFKNNSLKTFSINASFRADQVCWYKYNVRQKKMNETWYWIYCRVNLLI